MPSVHFVQRKERLIIILVLLNHPILGNCRWQEAFGLSLPGNSALCATDPTLEALAEEAGRRVMELVSRDLRAKDIVTPAAFRNAVKVCCATSGSTNLTLHFPAIAHELDYPFTLDDFAVPKTAHFLSGDVTFVFIDPVRQSLLTIFLLTSACPCGSIVKWFNHLKGWL